MSPAWPPPAPGSRGHIGWVVAGSLAAGLFFALLLAFAPFIPPQEREVMGAVLCGFALGWAMLAVLSTRFTDQPQRWAAVPAAFMGLGGLLLLAFASGVDRVLSWLWPPALLALVIWMVFRARRQLHSPTRRWLLYPVFAILALASIGGGYEAVRAATATTYSMPGQLIDVGGHRLHLSCTGSGSPTVVLEPGAGAMSSDMGWIAPAVARDTRVCVYDRAGRGWSDPADPPQDGTQIASDLHTLLHRGHVPGPFVLAGHSFGGLYVLNFATRSPDEVAGLVLIDSTAPASAPAPRTSSAGSYEPMSRVSALLSTSARFGLTRLYASLDYGSLPPRSREEVRASVATAENLQSTIDEYVQGSASAKEAAGLEDFGHKPLFVLTAGEGTAAGWMAKQDKLAALSTNSVHRVVDGAAHVDLVMNERPAAATSHAILDVVSSVRSGRPLDR
jgi:pimeloyl-ACP methyl ester carboxylesterase